jgi:acetolactate synthase-1/2/3 large subunit
MDGKGLLPDDHPLYIGPVGTYCNPFANKLLSEADLVFFCGCGAGDQVTKNWTLPPVGSTVVQLDINPAELGKNYPGTIGIPGDAKTTLNLLVDSLPGNNRIKDWSRRAHELYTNWEKTTEPKYNSDAVPIRPERLCRELTRALPEDAIVVADTGYSAIWAGTLIRITSPDQLFLRAAGSLGWAFPAALGAKCAFQDRPVVCFSGDGAFWYHISELETAVRCGIHTVTVINNNSVLGQCQRGIRRAYGDYRGSEKEQFRFMDTDFAQIANDMGAFGIRVEKPNEIHPAILQALVQNRPAVVDVATEAESHPVLK